MAKLMTDEVKQEVKKQLQGLKGQVALIFFTQPMACGACAEQQELLEAIVEQSDKLSLEIYQLDSKQAHDYGIDKVPATVVRNTQDYGIRFYGLTGGYEFGSLMEAIHLVSHGREGVDKGIAALAQMFREPLHLEIMVTLACPYCPKMVRLAHQLAVANDHIRADMVDAAEFPQLVNRYDVHSTPLTVVNGQRAFEGAIAPEQAVMQILKSADPDAYEQIQRQLRAAQGVDKSTTAEESELYDVIVVGAGPAGLTAALYSQRKGRKTALIGKKAGGQINDTASIENYPGLIQVGGAELAQAMREHMEAYPVAERCHTQVEKIEKQGDTFLVHTEDQKTYQGKTVIYAAGKRNRRLEVPGEERFIGRGIAWCATCDAPLFKDKSVAVVGGGNSAFTAIRDLMRYAKEIHLVHILDTFNADPMLVEQVMKAAEVAGHISVGNGFGHTSVRPEGDAPGKAQNKLKIHLNAQIKEYLGKDELQGVRLATKNGEPLQDLHVQGVFLEIGLVPNTQPIVELIELNEHGEVPTQRDQSTELPGLFVAGDVTDEPDKQIVIAAGGGAKAALSADRYLASLK